MRLNPHYITNLVSSLSATSSTEQQLTQQLASGSRVNHLSDDPIAAGENVLLSAQIQSDDSFSRTASSTQSMLQVSDSALGSVVSQLTTAISLTTQANNGTLNASDIQSIAKQLAGIRDEVVSLANTTYLGRYIFAGTRGDTAPFSLDTTTSPAGVVYNGDADVNTVQTPNGQQIQLNLPGDQIFVAAGADVLGTLNKLVADFSSGAPSADAIADSQGLSTALRHVSQQRVLIDNSISRLSAAESYTQSEATQLKAVQTDLLQADVGQIATELSTAETQQSALTQVIATVGRHTLFDAL